MNERRLIVTMLCACIMHVAVVSMIVASRGQVTPAAPSPPPAMSSVEIDLLVAPSSSSSSSSSSSAVVSDSAEDDHLTAPTTTTRQRIVRATTETAASAAVDEKENVVELEGPKAEGWTFNPRVVGVGTGAGVVRNIGLGASGAALVQGSLVRGNESPPTSRTGGASKSGGLIEGLDARDREVGLSRSGPLVAAVEDAVHEGNGPVEGRAVFVVTIDRDRGVVVELANADKEANAWRALAALIKAKAEAKAVRLPPNAQGIVAQIEVRADVMWPDGQKQRDTDRPITTEVKGLTVSENGETISTPSAAVHVHGKVCNATIRTPGATIGAGWIVIHDPITGSCSPENIGANAQRVVHGRIIREQRL